MITILAGAGASKAVNAKAYPTTVEFFAGLPKQVANDGVFRAVCSFLSERQQSEKIDIEQWLWAAGEARKAFDDVGNRATAIGWLSADNRICGQIGNNADLRPALGAYSQAARHLMSLEDRIQRQVYELYHRAPSPAELQATCLPLLKWLTTGNERVELFTTNYDVVLESAIEVGNLPFATGRTKGVYSVLSEEPWLNAQAPATSDAVGLLTKLHGSVDWSRNGNVVYYGTPTFRGDHSQHAIIYPGFKGQPTDAPFTYFHEHFSRSVSTSDMFVAVGFAFRDEYINRIIRDRLPAHAEVLVLDPAQRVAVPIPERRVTHIPLAFDQDGLDEVVAAIGRARSGMQRGRVRTPQ